MKKSTISIGLIAIALFLIIPAGSYPSSSVANPLLPHVSSNMEKPDFWIKKVQNPNRPLLTFDEIQRFNEENLRNRDLLLCKVKDLKDDWTEGEIITLLEEDWKNFAKPEEIRYGRDGSRLIGPFWNDVRSNINVVSLKKMNRMHFGLTIKRTDIRVFPTEEASMSTPSDSEFDRFQHSSIAPGSLIGVYHLSKDRIWAYAQTAFVRGWIRTDALAMAKERSEAVAYEELKDGLVITGSFVTIFSDPSLQEIACVAQMGTSFPMLGQGVKSGGPEPLYVIKIPIRKSDGSLTFGEAYAPKREGNVHLGHLPFTQENLARQAFKMLHEPYGWGEMFGARDCSRFIMDLFGTFGIRMPRNSKLQARVGIPLGQIEGKTPKEKQRVLDRATPMATLLRFPGHIMLYLGKDRGRYYVIHSMWGFERRDEFGPILEKIGRVVVSELTLGRSGPNRSFLQRLTDIQVIGHDPKKKVLPSSGFTFPK